MGQLKIVILGACFSLLVMGNGGNLVGNSGDPYTAEFRFIARSILKQFKAGELRPGDIDTKQLENIIESAVVTSKKDLFLWNDRLQRSVEVDAINYFPNFLWIEISRSRWKALQVTEHKKALVLHEYLMLMGVPDKTYAVSSRYFFKSNRPPIMIPPSF